MADKTENIKTRLSFDGEAEYKAACREINSTLKVLNSESVSSGVTIKPLTQKAIDENPYMAKKYEMDDRVRYTRFGCILWTDA